MVKKALLAVVALLVVLVLVVLTRPAHYQVVRKARIAAAPGQVFTHVADFHQWPAWSPWAKLDPAMQVTYQGPTAAAGSVYAWVGNDKVGAGRMTIERAEPPGRVEIKLEFLKPFAATASTVFTFSGEGPATEVAWAMDGENDFMGKAMSLFGGMDAMIGPDFEKGLAQLKQAVEAPAPP